MKLALPPILCVVLGLGATLALAQGDIAPVPLPVDAAKLDIAGTWNYSTSNHRVSGVCPNGAPMSGVLEIVRDGTGVQVMVASGATCDPAAMCFYDGAIEGGEIVVSNTAVVDDEGGSATNALRLFFSSESAGGGESSSRYVHPKGFECHWTHHIDLWRSE